MPCVSREAVLAVEDVAVIRLAVAVGVGQAVDVGDAVDEALAVGTRQDADGDVEAVGEGGDLARQAVVGEVVEDLDGVLGRAIRAGPGRDTRRIRSPTAGPSASKAMLIGLLIFGSAATSSISKPGGRWNVFCCSWGVKGGVDAILGSGFWP